MEGRDPEDIEADKMDKKYLMLCILLIVAIILLAGLTILIFAIAQDKGKPEYVRIVPDQPL